MPREIELESCLEGLGADPVVKHVDDGGALGVRDVVKDFIDLTRMLYTVRDLDWM